MVHFNEEINFYGWALYFTWSVRKYVAYFIISFDFLCDGIVTMRRDGVVVRASAS